MKYLVMEVRLGYAVLLDEEGRFIKAADMNYQVGESVTDVFIINEAERPVTEKKKAPSWVYAMAAMAACLVIMAGFLVNSFMSPFASVYISINPRVRIDVNKQDMVVGVEGVNEDGVILLEGYDYRRKSLDLVVDELVDLAIDYGYLHEGGKITLTLDANDDWVVSHSEHLSQQITQHLTDRYTVTIDIGATKDTPDITQPSENPPQQTTSESQPAAPATTPQSPPSSDTDYGDTDYNTPAVTDGDTDYSDTDYGEPSQTEPVQDTDYDDTEDSHTDYYNEAPNPDTDYGASDSETDYDDDDDDDGNTDYSDTDYGY